MLRKISLGGGYSTNLLSKDVKEINKVFLSLFSVGIILVAVFTSLKLTNNSYALFSDTIVGEKTIEVEVIIEDNWNYSYTGFFQTFVVPYDGIYKIELWGASVGDDETIKASKGGYVSGEIILEKDEKLYLYVGGMGEIKSNFTTMGGYNGGGSSSKSNNGKSGPTGGGATDVRGVDGSWDNDISLRRRLRVAGGGAPSSVISSSHKNISFGNAGGLIGENGNYGIYDGGTVDYLIYVGKGGTQVGGGIAPTKGPVAVTNGTSGLFGQGGTGGQNVNNTTGGGGAGGGSGYYGGSGGTGGSSGSQPGGGGSSYISGHTGCVAITSEDDETPKSGCTTGTTNNSCSIHYSGKVFTNTVMIDGAGYNWTNTKGSLKSMPSPNGGYYENGLGHTGNGYAKITLVY